MHDTRSMQSSFFFQGTAPLFHTAVASSAASAHNAKHPFIFSLQQQQQLMQPIQRTLFPLCSGSSNSSSCTQCNAPLFSLYSGSSSSSSCTQCNAPLFACFLTCKALLFHAAVVAAAAAFFFSTQGTLLFLCSAVAVAAAVPAGARLCCLQGSPDKGAWWRRRR